MKPLETVQRFSIWLCIHPTDESSTVQQKRAYIILASVLLILHSTMFVGSLAFCVKFVSINLNKCMFAFMIAAAAFGSMYMMIAGIAVMRPKMAAIFKDLSAIYNNNDTADSFRFLVQANNTCEWMGIIYIKYALGIMGVTILMFPISVLYCWLLNGHLNVDNFYHPAPLELPWNQTSLLGYVGESFVVASFGFVYLTALGTFLVLFISMSLHHQAFYKMFEHKIDELDRSDESQCDGEFLCDLIRFHISAKDWFLTSAQVYSPSVMVQLICSLIFMAVSIFYLDLRAHHIDFYVITAMATLSLGVLNALIYCYFGSKATESYEKMGDHIFELDWYKLPIKKQTYFNVMAANMQKPIHYHGFGVLYLNLETFTRLIRSVYSYYMSIKTITT